MTDGILNFPKPAKPTAFVTHDQIKDEISLIAYASTLPENTGGPAKVIEELLGSIVSKCSLCASDKDGTTELQMVVECKALDCPLRSIANMVFQSLIFRSAKDRESEGNA